MTTFDHNNHAASARAAEDQRRLAICDEIENLIAPVRDEHPDVRIFELGLYLPEPERSRLAALLDELPEIIPFPKEA
ncbi:hypothetical protein FTW19_11575 [Terriglobus albidus]|uniref:Uncharacterized protein n=1 Tax=Terriglobus albidus TaxID=1592106 RepID=A0A5B9ECY6_9BACT|nr:hypothetical protein [Terriglobus albidus]QEE28580.1 hypothetical protein FTW19_11575 [Terriglobus albidus]